MAIMPSRHPITIRLAKHQDSTKIAELGAHVFTLTFGHSVPLEELQVYLNESWSREAIFNDISDPMKDMIVASNREGDIVGFAMLIRGTSEPCIEHLSSTAEFQRIYVDPNYHGKGIGRLLVSKLEELAAEQDVKMFGWVSGRRTTTLGRFMRN